MAKSLTEMATTAPTGDPPPIPDPHSAATELEQIRVQLAGCLHAAEGGTSPEHVAMPGAYGWSPAYAAVLELRMAFDALAQGRSPKDVVIAAREREAKKAEWVDPVKRPATGNHFSVRPQNRGEYVMVLRPILGRIPQSDALVAAAHIVRCADPNNVMFGEILELVKKEP